MTTHYVIIGNGVAGTEAALTIRSRHSPKRARITLIGAETPYFFSRTALMYAYMNKLERKDLEPYERKVYDRKKIERIHDRVCDLDADAQTLTLEDGSQIEFDRCLIATGASPRMVPFPGADDVKEGLVHFVSMQDLDHCERLTWTSEQATVIGGGLIGVELAECFHHHGLEVTFLVREPYFWPAALAAEEGQMITEHIRDHGINICHETELTQINVDQDGRVRALETNTEETIASQMLGICIGVVANIEWLNAVQTPPAMERSLCVDRSFQTSLAGVFGAGDCVQIDMGSDQPPRVETIWYAARLHGQLAAKSMMGDDIHYEPPIFYNSSKFFDIEYTTVGELHDLPPDTRTIYRRMPGKNISQRIVFNGKGQVLGFNMLASRWDHRILSRWISERRSIEFVRENLRQAQFDVEFGRVDLEAMQEEVRTL